ncbi:MAG TPA: inositol monophosphatase family protein [Bacteroidia bacterium]|jgi:myo-inositol-1(or 4)-monophosphatase|nr:inositol monophosphatase family protein [Bacteroidia bacterium]
MSPLFDSSTPDLALLCGEMQMLSMQVGQFIREEKKKFSSASVEEKQHAGLVSYVDKTAEEKFIEGLTRIWNVPGIIGEENTGDRKSDRFNWIIDPLDGTTNFVHGIPFYATSIALADGKEILAGVIYEINMDECFYAYKNGGAWMNGEKIGVSTESELKNCLLGTGFPYAGKDEHEKYVQLFSYLQLHSRGIRRPGSAATDIAYVACGRFDAFYEYNLSPWDVAAGKILVEEAGGFTSEFNGGNDPVFGKTFVCGNKKIQKEITSIIQQYFI